MIGGFGAPLLHIASQASFTFWLNGKLALRHAGG
ncbi:hypothetical protein ABID08_000035 [Rhizobium binae]|uniref:Uncharacterized protein n=1 Tax=Rhizobium binae TaxID=1138190 RepID=A0ABV2M8I0_9HYPH